MAHGKKRCPRKIDRDDPTPERTSRVVKIQSFGFKYNETPVSDLQIDLRNKLRNPQSNLPKEAIGLDRVVIDTVLGTDTNRSVFERCYARISKLLNRNSEAVIAFGCTNGILRSVVFAEEAGVRLRKDGLYVTVTHVHLRFPQ